MNRRSFLESLAKAAAAFTILPSALTYERKRERAGDLWLSQTPAIGCCGADPAYSCVMLPPSEEQRRFVTMFFFGVEIPSDTPVWSYEEFIKRRRENGLTP